MPKSPKRIFSFKPNSRVTPAGDETTKDFLRSFGTINQLKEFMDYSGMHVTKDMIENWGRSGTLPEQAYSLLMDLRRDGLIQQKADGNEIDSLEIYVGGNLIGRMELPRYVKVKVKKWRVG